MAINQMTNLTWILKFEKKKKKLELGKQKDNSPKVLELSLFLSEAEGFCCAQCGSTREFS